MAKEFFEDFSGSKDVFDIAIGLLGYDLSQRCFHGPAEKLNLTEDTQPAILATRFFRSCHFCFRQSKIST
jgi:[acyl-carrier-protein] S-malonyltransferase